MTRYDNSPIFAGLVGASLVTTAFFARLRRISFLRRAIFSVFASMAIGLFKELVAVIGGVLLEALANVIDIVDRNFPVIDAVSEDYGPGQKCGPDQENLFLIERKLLQTNLLSSLSRE